MPGRFERFDSDWNTTTFARSAPAHSSALPGASLVKISESHSSLKMKKPEPKSPPPDDHHGGGQSTKKGAQEASKLRETPGERAQRDAATTAPCSPGQPAGGE